MSHAAQAPAPAAPAPAAPAPAAHAPAAPVPRAALVRAPRGDAARTFDVLCALAAVVLTGLRVPLGYGVTPGLLVALVLVPVWVPRLRDVAGARLVVALGVLAAVAGAWLTAFAGHGRSVSLPLAFSTTATLLGIVGGVGVLLWARTHLSLAVVGALLGLGMVASQVLYRGQWGVNPWKFAFVVPVAVVVLSLALATRRRWVELLALVVLAGASAAQDSRSAFALFALAAALLLWQVLPAAPGTSRGLRAVRLVAFGAIAVAAVYNVGSALVLEGFLGQAAQERSQAQVAASGSLLLGARPELAAATALIRAEPAGFGPGALPSAIDVAVAKEGMRSVGYEPDNGYVEHFMFGTQFRLHSVVGDTWAAFGPLGGLWVLVSLGVLVASVVAAAAGRSASGLVLWLLPLTAWNAFFGPLYGSAAALVAALGLGLLTRQTAQDRPYSSTSPPRAPRSTPEPRATSR